ncbi:peptide-methionine (S)-S-oxide reductase, partial [Sphingomonas sp. CCH9-F2]
MFRTLAVAATLSLAACGSAQAERAVPLPAAAQDVPPGTGTQVAVLAGGCFWGMEAVFEQLKGVRSVTSGYAGGTRATANYADVSSETTRHAEA